MIHVGDITKLNGAKLPVVDVITGGSPCQDLSVAGKREGLEGERSGLFMEMVRVVKEMREHDMSNGRTGQFVRPRYMVWENVPGALSSNKGKDFQAVLAEIIKIIQEAPDVPLPNNGWPKQGCLYDEMGRWSIAWRVHDAQFWGATQYVNERVFFRGTPQRRKRIALIADFGGRSAPEILFERKGLSGDHQESEREEQAVAGGTGESTERTVAIEGNGSRQSHHGNGYKVTDKMYSLNTVEVHAVATDRSQSN